MRKIYHLKTCSTNVRILKELNLEGVDLVNIKEEEILKEDIEFAIEKLGGVDAVFSKRAMKYRQLGLNQKDLTEEEMKDWILKEYTFLKRPLIILDDFVSAGSAKKDIEKVKSILNE